jgi:hypothetical protein
MYQKGCGSRFVCVLLRNQLLTSFIHRKRGVMGFFVVFSGFLLKTFCSGVMVSFASHHHLPRPLVNFQLINELQWLLCNLKGIYG